MTVFCARAGCVHRGHHAADCTDDRCTGCQPWPAADGLELCQHHADRIAPDALALGELYDELDHVLLTAGRAGERVGGRGDDGPPVPRDRVVAIRTEIRHTLVSWCRLVAEERGVSLPSGAGNGPQRAVERRTGHPEGDRMHAEPSCRILAAYVARHAGADGQWWLAAHQGVAGHVSEELDDLRRRAWSVAYPTGTKVVTVGPCPVALVAEVVTHDWARSEDGNLRCARCRLWASFDCGDPCVPEQMCDGMLRAIVRPAETLLPSEVACSEDPAHRWAASEWRQLDRLVSGRRAA